jgi:hypothetical protein
MPMFPIVVVGDVLLPDDSEFCYPTIMGSSLDDLLRYHIPIDSVTQAGSSFEIEAKKSELRESVKLVLESMGADTSIVKSKGAYNKIRAAFGMVATYVVIPLKIEDFPLAYPYEDDFGPEPYSLDTLPEE